MSAMLSGLPTPRKSLEPWVKDEILYYEHQIEGIRDLLRRGGSFLLADEPGLGKSIQALTIFACDVIRGWSTTLIIVCPVSLKGNWADEIEKWSRFPYVTLGGTPRERDKQILQFTGTVGPKILIVNYELLAKHLPTLNAIGFDAAIYDEAHYIKNHSSLRTKSVHKLHSRKDMLLTGTPMLNHVNELWGLLHKLDPIAFPKYWSFVNRYCVFGGWQSKQITGVQNEKELTERLGRYMVRRLKKDVLDLPDVQIVERRVDLSPEQQKLYDQVVDDMRLDKWDLDDPMDIENALTKFLRLKQICGTTLAFTGQDISSKLDLAIEDDLEILDGGHKIVVFTQFRDVQAAYVARMAGKAEVYQLHGDVKQELRQGVVHAWSNSATPAVIVCMLQVAGVGLNMTAARHGSFLDKLFVPGLNQQAIDRMHRIGTSTTQPVQIREYICRNTIENRVNQILRIKSKLFGEVIEPDVAWKKKLLAEIMKSEHG